MSVDGWKSVLVLGGIRSGKSAFAEALLADAPAVRYVATAVGGEDDPEWLARIEEHQRRRPQSWTTEETGADPHRLIAVLTEAKPDETLLVDDMGGWAAALLNPELQPNDDLATVNALATAVRECAARVVVVSPEVGLSLVPQTPLGRAFADAVGTVNQALAEACDRVALIVAGRPAWLKDLSGTPGSAPIPPVADPASPSPRVEPVPAPAPSEPPNAARTSSSPTNGTSAASAPTSATPSVSATDPTAAATSASATGAVSAADPTAAAASASAAASVSAAAAGAPLIASPRRAPGTASTPSTSGIGEVPDISEMSGKRGTSGAGPESDPQTASEARTAKDPQEAHGAGAVSSPQEGHGAGAVNDPEEGHGAGAVVGAPAVIEAGLDVPLPDSDAGPDARDRLDRLDLPGQGVGVLLEAIEFAAATQGTATPQPWGPVRVLLFDGRHAGGAAAGADPADSGRRAALAESGEGPIARLAATADADVALVRVPESGPMEDGPVLGPEAVDAALRQGWELAAAAVTDGREALVLASCGAGAEAAATAVLAATTGAEPVGVLPRVLRPGGFYDDESWMRRCAAVRDAMHRIRQEPRGAKDILAQLGGADLAVATGALLGAAANRLPVILDGPLGVAAGLIARDISTQSRHWCLLADAGKHKLVSQAADVLGLNPVLELGLDLGEGANALAALPLMRTAIALAASLPVHPGLLDNPGDVPEEPPAVRPTGTGVPGARPWRTDGRPGSA